MQQEYKICLLKNFLKNNYTFFITDFENLKFLSLRTSPCQNTKPKEIAANLFLGLASQSVHIFLAQPSKAGNTGYMKMIRK